MRPNKHGNSVTIFKLYTSAQLDCKINVLRGFVPTSQAKVDYLNLVTELPCLLVLTVSELTYWSFITEVMHVSIVLIV